MSSSQQRALAGILLAQKKTVNPQTYYQFLKEVTPDWNWDLPHLKIIEPHLQDILDGIPKKIIVMEPVRHGKSEYATIRFPACFLEKFPEKKVVIGAYNHTFCTDFSRAVRRILSNRINFGEKNTANHWETEAGGSLMAVGVGVGIAGRGCHLLVIDDPIRNYEEANSQAYRNKVWNWFLNDVSTRVEPNGSIILTMARWHYDDLVGRILSSEDASNWIVIKIPAIADDNDILGRQKGEALWEERYPLSKLMEIRRNNPSGFAALYQQSPEIDGGNIFKRDKFKFVSTLPNFEFIIQSIDGAWEINKENDYSVCTTYGVAGNNAYLIDIWRDKVHYSEFKKMIKDQYQKQKHKPMRILIEKAASGIAAIQELSRETMLPIEAIKPEGSKEVRAYAITPLIESGRFLIYDQIEHKLDFLDEMCAFPKASHDDIVDTVTMALNYIKNFNTCPISIF